MVGVLSHTSYLIDTDRRMYTVYMETNGQIDPAPLYKAYDKRRLAKAAMNLMRLFRNTRESKNNDRQGF
jgi:hypothetical protein